MAISAIAADKREGRRNGHGKQRGNLTGLIFC